MSDESYVAQFTIRDFNYLYNTDSTTVTNGLLQFLQNEFLNPQQLRGHLDHLWLGFSEFFNQLFGVRIRISYLLHLPKHIHHCSHRGVWLGLNAILHFKLIEHWG